MTGGFGRHDVNTRQDGGSNRLDDAARAGWL